MTDAPDPTTASRGHRLARPVVVVPVLAGLLILAIRLWMKWGGDFPGDQWALHHLETTTLPAPLVDLGTFFSVIGTPTVAMLTLAAVLPIVLRTDGVRGAAFVVLAGCGVFFNMLLKVLSGPTPIMLEKYPGMPDGLNYPSGHTVYGAVFFGSLAWLAWRHRRYEIVAPLIVLILAMGPFRVIAEAHFVSDVLAAYLAGIAWLLPVAVLTGMTGSRRPAPPAGAPPAESMPADHTPVDSTPVESTPAASSLAEPTP